MTLAKVAYGLEMNAIFLSDSIFFPSHLDYVKY
jgi:hypothetical protein